MPFTTRLIAALAMLMVTPLLVHAEQSQSMGNYVIHYNAFATGDLSPGIAKNYGITRSKNRALLNVTVLKKVLGTPGQPVTAQLKVSAVNLSRQMQVLEPREVHESNAIYYLMEFTIADQEIIDLTIDVTPEHQSETAHIKLRQQFFTH
jgi:hypothetical protein